MSLENDPDGLESRPKIYRGAVASEAPVDALLLPLYEQPFDHRCLVAWHQLPE